MIPAAAALLLLAVLLLFVFPWGGIVAGIVGLALLVAALLGLGRGRASD